MEKFNESSSFLRPILKINEPLFNHPRNARLVGFKKNAMLTD